MQCLPDQLDDLFILHQLCILQWRHPLSIWDLHLLFGHVLQKLSYVLHQIIVDSVVQWQNTRLLIECQQYLFVYFYWFSIAHRLNVGMIVGWLTLGLWSRDSSAQVALLFFSTLDKDSQPLPNGLVIRIRVLDIQLFCLVLWQPSTFLP